ncbi:hypothetical protein [Pleurocapsa sp. CCALA 161]|uniref:hypothetical protein n=1 Tax=Pleurocapsa sp. CCALA 161 TaxID=2107688 RepID=UPI0018EBC286|nr:hypothetical protein [Pleurocapsa sp. CCALA 161]
MIDRFLYEKSTTHLECLIIPFVYSYVDGQDIYSYALLSEQGYTSILHQAENPAKLYSGEIEGIIAIAKQHLDTQITLAGSHYFRQRYTYDHNLIIIHQQVNKCFYDHYAPSKLVNIAAPKIFFNASDCIDWVKLGLQRNTNL